MKRILCLYLPLCLACTMLLQAQQADPPAAVPPNPQNESLTAPDEALISISFDETPLTDVIKAFRNTTGANIIFSGTNLNQVVSVRLENVPWRKGLASVIDPYDLQIIERPAASGIYVVEPKTVVEIPKVTRVFTLEYSKAEDVADLLQATLKGSGGTAIPFKESNTIVASMPEYLVEECEMITQAVDKLSPQVYIEIRFVEMSAAASKKLGLRWDVLGQEDGWGMELSDLGAGLEYGKTRQRTSDSGWGYQVDSETSGSSLTSSTAKNKIRNAMRGVGGQLTADDFRLALNAFEQIGGVSVFSNPKIIVANEKEAVVDMTTKEPNLTVTSSRTGTAGDQLDISARLELIPGHQGDKDGKGRGLFAGEAFFSHGINIKVTPRISPTGLITLNVEPSISNKEGYYEFKGVSDNSPTPKYPIIEMQRLQTVFTMQDGSTAVIGGLTRTTEESTDSGIPLLRKIPWLGSRIFGWKSRQKMQKEIIIFVTVGIADPIGLPEQIGMPKNAILSRDLFTGELKEPGDRTKAEVLSISDRKPKKQAQENVTPEVTVSETPEPLLQTN